MIGWQYCRPMAAINLCLPPEPDRYLGEVDFIITNNSSVNVQVIIGAQFRENQIYPDATGTEVFAGEVKKFRINLRNGDMGTMLELSVLYDQFPTKEKHCLIGTVGENIFIGERQLVIDDFGLELDKR